MMATAIFAALGSPIRRRILELLLEGPSTVNTFVDAFQLSRPSVSEHLQVLRIAKLVRDERRGRERFYHIEPRRLVEGQEWLKPFQHDWRQRMQALDAALDQENDDD